MQPQVQLYYRQIKLFFKILEFQKMKNCHIIALQLLTNCYSELNNFANVEKLCSKLIRCNPNVGYFSRANYYYRTEENQKAVDNFNEGLKYKRDDPVALFLRAQSYFNLKVYKKALSDFKRVKQLTLSTPENQRQLNIKKIDEMIVQCEKLKNQYR